MRGRSQYDDWCPVEAAGHQNSPHIPPDIKGRTKGHRPSYGTLPYSTLGATMAVDHCANEFKMIKYDNTLIQWTCNLCNSGPHWFIFECKYCKLHTCRTCTQ